MFIRTINNLSSPDFNASEPDFFLIAQRQNCEGLLVNTVTNCIATFAKVNHLVFYNRDIAKLRWGV